MRDSDTQNLVIVAGVIAGGGLLAWALTRRQPSPPPPAASDADRSPITVVPQPPRTGWQWPVPMWGEYSPTISDGWGSGRRRLDGTRRTHEGVDLMFPRKSLDDQATLYPAGSAGGSTWHFVPPGIPALAARDGRVTWAGKTARGYAVTVRHADGWRTFYQHLAMLLVNTGDLVAAGEVLGEIGGDPTQRPPLRHLHFQLHAPPAGNPIDPKPHLLTWPRVRPLDVADGAIASVLVPPPRLA
jgi:murein DD-endopeptidase MepM/ murein hydrolase activator NlpD